MYRHKNEQNLPKEFTQYKLNLMNQVNDDPKYICHCKIKIQNALHYREFWEHVLYSFCNDHMKIRRTKTEISTVSKLVHRPSMKKILELSTMQQSQVHQNK